jgi:mono/diheme cytochrome c family protein
MNFKFLIPGLSIAALIFSLLVSCNKKKSPPSDDTAIDTAAIRKGQIIFSQQCGACHNFRQDGIGPQLGGILSAVSSDWVVSFVKNPQLVIESGDERAHLLFEKYKTIMPSFQNLSEDELLSLVAFLSTKEAPDPMKTKFDPNALTNPIPEPIGSSGITVGLELLTTIPPSSTEGQLTRICKLDFRPDTKDLFVVDLRGRLYMLKDSRPEIYLDMVKEKPKFIHKPGLATGFGSFAFHPEFATNGLLYTTHVESPGSGKADFDYNDSIKVTLQWVLSEWKTENPNAIPFQGKSRELFRACRTQKSKGNKLGYT